MFGGPVLAAGLHGSGWWGTLAALLSFGFTVAFLNHLAGAVLGIVVVWALRTLSWWLLLTIVGVALAGLVYLVVTLPPPDADGGEGAHGSYKVLRHEVPRGASAAVAGVLSGKDHYAVRALAPVIPCCPTCKRSLENRVPLASALVNPGPLRGARIACCFISHVHYAYMHDADVVQLLGLGASVQPDKDAIRPCGKRFRAC